MPNEKSKRQSSSQRKAEASDFIRAVDRAEVLRSSPDVTQEIWKENLRQIDHRNRLYGLTRAREMIRNYGTCLICQRRLLNNGSAVAEPDWYARRYGLGPQYCTDCISIILCDHDWKFASMGSFAEIRPRPGSPSFSLDVDYERAVQIVGTQLFVDHFDFIPPSNLNRASFVERIIARQLPPEAEASELRALGLLPFAYYSKRIFGDWAHLLNCAGLLAASRSGHSGYRSIASDGHVCLSVGERTVCEYLTKIGIAHEKEPLYPYDAQSNPGEKLRADFRVGSTLIEFAGRLSDDQYVERLKVKQNLALAHGLTWICITDKDLADLAFLGSALRTG